MNKFLCVFAALLAAATAAYLPYGNPPAIGGYANQVQPELTVQYLVPSPAPYAVPSVPYAAPAPHYPAPAPHYPAPAPHYHASAPYAAGVDGEAISLAHLGLHTPQIAGPIGISSYAAPAPIPSYPAHIPSYPAHIPSYPAHIPSHPAVYSPASAANIASAAAASSALTGSPYAAPEPSLALLPGYAVGPAYHAPAHPAPIY